MQVLVQEHVHDLFLPDNASELQRRMWHFSMLLVWHDPRLAAHLSRMQFQPELYTIPWFLTLFSHVLPLEKTFRLWDGLLLHDPSMIVRQPQPQPHCNALLTPTPTPGPRSRCHHPAVPRRAPREQLQRLRALL